VRALALVLIGGQRLFVGDIRSSCSAEDTRQPCALISVVLGGVPCFALHCLRCLAVLCGPPLGCSAVRVLRWD
jgi:hypothetical protein